MAATGWSASLDTGHSDVDEQHREIFRLHAAAVDAARGDGRATKECLQDLLDRTAEHFAFEERLMSATAYAGRERHVEAHRTFMRDVLALVAEAARDGTSGLVRLWLESRYASWWRLHVRTNDLALAAHVRSLPSPEPAPAAAPRPTTA